VSLPWVLQDTKPQPPWVPHHALASSLLCSVFSCWFAIAGVACWFAMAVKTATVKMFTWHWQADPPRTHTHPTHLCRHSIYVCNWVRFHPQGHLGHG
jgi:hypothetical protein